MRKNKMNDIKKLIKNTILQILEDNKTDSLIKKIEKKHDEKVHFIPFRYRVFGGFLQSLKHSIWKFY